VGFVLDSVGLDDLNEAGVWVIREVPVRKGMLNLREKSGLLRKLTLSLGRPAASPALS
jgi:hypothetical protein